MWTKSAVKCKYLKLIVWNACVLHPPLKFTLKTSIKTRKYNDLRNSIKNLDVQQHLTKYLTTKKKTDDDLLYLFDPRIVYLEEPSNMNQNKIIALDRSAENPVCETQEHYILL